MQGKPGYMFLTDGSVTFRVAELMLLQIQRISEMFYHIPVTFLNLPYTKIQYSRWSIGECSGSVTECLTRDRRDVGLSLTTVTALCP